MSEEALKVRTYWIEKLGPNKWDANCPDQDREIKSNFEDLWALGRDGELGAWMCTPENCLSLLILLDQMPRAMFRGTGQAYESDGNALAIAKRGIVMGHDLKIPEPERQFFYTPLMHSESLMDQERCVRLVSLRMPRMGYGCLLHAKAHRDIIRQFGRFPYRNDALGRPSTEAELSYVNAGGYEASVSAHAA